MWRGDCIYRGNPSAHRMQQVRDQFERCFGRGLIDSVQQHQPTGAQRTMVNLQPDVSKGAIRKTSGPVQSTKLQHAAPHVNQASCDPVVTPQHRSTRPSGVASLPNRTTTKPLPASSVGATARNPSARVNEGTEQDQPQPCFDGIHAVPHRTRDLFHPMDAADSPERAYFTGTAHGLVNNPTLSASRNNAFAGQYPAYQAGNIQLPSTSNTGQIDGALIAPPVFRPTPEQISARHVVPRDLPEFSGDPEDWPLFHSSFNNSTNACGYSHAENLARLQRCLKGDALKAVRYYLLSPESVPDVLKTLQTLFGRPEIIVNKLIRNVRDCPIPKAERLETLIDFGMTVRNLTQHLISAGQQAHLSNPVLLQELIEKLPANIKLQWAQHLIYYPVPSLQTFSDFMSGVVESVAKVVPYGGGQSRSDRPRAKEKGFVHTHSETLSPNIVTIQRSSPSEKSCFVCSKLGHRVKECERFKGSSIEDRWKIVRSSKLCRSCLSPHGRRACKNLSFCGINGCQYRHHPLLHSPSTTIDQPTKESHNYHHCGQSVLFRIVQVTLYGVSGSLDVFALLDEGSSTTLIERSLTEELDVYGPTVPLCLTWTGDMSRSERDSKMVTFDVSEVEKQKRYPIKNARTVSSLNLPAQTLRFKELQKQYVHLKGLPIRSYENAKPRLLIGLRDISLAVPRIIKDGNNGPIATKTLLGWTLYGCFSGASKPEYLNFHACECEGLNELVRTYINGECNDMQPARQMESEAEKRARYLLEQTTVRVGDRFQTGLLWKHDEVKMPESYPMALRRLECLERRINRDLVLKENVHRQVAEYQEKGYAHRATIEELRLADPRRIWYLPLGAVINPKKPEKVRLIWDAAAKVNGISLNSVLLPGPDLLTPLPAVLFRFRQFPVAVSSNIREMFHRILVTEADRHSQRFLWRNCPDQKPQIFLMDVITFGATSSPVSAQFVKNKNALEFVDRCPRAVEGILKSHYVDDYLDSFETVGEAKSVSSEVRAIHLKGGFEVHNWSSNNKEVLENLEVAATKAEKHLTSNRDTNTERILGMLWNPEEDKLGFSTKFNDEIAMLIENGLRPTKRQILKCVMSLFDPLGLLACHLVHGKVLMQDVWRTGISWDEPVSDEIMRHWERWIRLFSNVQNLRLPRCYFQNASSALYNSLQVHVFVDASEVAYSAAVYFRIIGADGIVQCSLVAAKTKVAPLKYVTIPRLELMAATLGTTLLSFVIDGHTIQIKKRFLWSDSKTVLSWIHSDHRKYRPFVAARIGQILTTTNETEWRWVPSKLNVADEATKWGKGPCFEANCRWFVGPDFLYTPETEWPKPNQVKVATTEEIRPCFLHHESLPTPLIEFQRFSKWSRLLRAVAYMLRAVSIWRASGMEAKRGMRSVSKSLVRLSHDNLVDAEMLIWKQVQMEAYPDDESLLSDNCSIPKDKRANQLKSSSLYALSPVMDEKGIIRVDGRIGNAKQVPMTVKYPIILPRRHHVTLLLVDHYHREFLHGNNETVCNEMRQRFYVPQLRVLIRKVSKQCQRCKTVKARPEIPRMGLLPAARLSPFVRPFSFVGLDYFGPLLVKVGRSNAKRWVALFTCLTIRAVHVEVAYDLSTASCISCINRFVSRRGAPLEIHSDNGRNFVGAANILKEQIKRIEFEVATTFTTTNTKWVFIPPLAPHMGGSWERMVRAIKTALFSLPQDRKMDDEALQTMLVKAEAIINSRPLTYLPLDSDEQEAITPNHFLLGSSSGTKQPAVPITDNRNLYKSWELIEQQLDIFWKRWVREYLPTLTRRTKWFEEVKPIEPGSLVMVVDDAKRNGWIRGRVLEVVAGQDGRIRQALVQTSAGVFRRPVSKLAVLDLKDSGKVASDTHLYRRGNVATESVTLPSTTYT